MLEEFDPIVKEHVRHIMNDELNVHYLGHTIQDELIDLLAKNIQSEIIKKIKRAKYYSIILDCTPDISHDEQMTIIVRYVDFDSKIVKVEESFLGFLVVDDTTGKGLFDVTLNELDRLGLDVDDMHGQGYDNGSNMKGKHQGVQRRFLDINPRAFYTPCGCHSLNLILCDMGNTCDKSREFFGVIQRLYTLFSRSVNRWDIMRQHVKGLTLKPLCTTRWESRVDSVKPIKLYLPDVREALLEVEATDKDTLIQSEAKSLAVNMVSDFEFLVALVIWYEVLSMVNVLSKKLQSEDMVIDVAIQEVNKLIEFFEEYREVGLAKAIDEAKIVATKMGVDPVFPQRRIIRKKKQFDDTSTEPEVLFSPEEDFKVNYFLYIVDQALASIEGRFEQYQQHEKLFGFLFPKRLRQLEESLLKSHCHALEDAPKYEGKADIDGDELFQELKLFERFLPSRIISPIDALQNLKEGGGVFPNAMIAYRVLLTIPVTVASAERSFSKLKLLKSYLRSTMSQDRLNGLAMISIESDMLENMNYESLIEDFASKNARRNARFT
ncbi:TTF-type zinc finger protein with HAT dimerization domain-containing protein [Artemisia annua]|uniref:TTF-type zinc finger protein with HAT dimerization domain-containing protein n=1 Tax=Artemisia annua TaxID=35608 RepID=A0A2U1KG09_ARTAN|nr:TTF-type zinc finger protein with HAT dimerization domain-containing protein [Artemisia annua]